MMTDVFLDQKKVNVCEHKIKTVPCDSFEKLPPEWVQDRKEGGVEGMKEKLKGNRVRLIP